MRRCDLNAVSLGCLASGPEYTYTSGTVRTTVDYILMDVDAISMVSSCSTHSAEELNTSDHLPLMYEAVSASSAGTSLTRIDWNLVWESGADEEYSKKIQDGLAPLLKHTYMYDDSSQIDSEIEHVARILVNTADEVLPLIEPKRKTRWKDDVLSRLCAQSRVARQAWRDAGSPAAGPHYEEKGRLRRAVRRRIQFCAAMAERRRIQLRERMFRTGDVRRFRTPLRKKKKCSKLVVNGKVVSDQNELLEVWRQHFSRLSKSRGDEVPELLVQKEKMASLELKSIWNEEGLLDIPFSLEEVKGAITKLKRKKAAGPDGVVAEHLIAGGDAVSLWLKGILNAVIEMEKIPAVLKCGVVVPVYKGGGRDPLEHKQLQGCDADICDC